MRDKSRKPSRALVVLFLFVVIGGVFLISRPKNITISKSGLIESAKEIVNKISEPKLEPLDKVAYDAKSLKIANLPPPKPAPTSTAGATNEAGELINEPAPEVPEEGPWPVKAPYPSSASIIPFKRVVAYYGNLYSTRMGALGEYPEEEMFTRLKTEVQNWEAADPETPVMPALHYIAVTAQGTAQSDGKYRLRMPFSEIDKIIEMAKKIDAIVFLDIQVGLSNVQEEIPLLEPYLKMPNVHLGLDPEFSMKTGKRPGTVIGTMDATDINYAAEYLAKVVRENELPPKILVVHRFTQGMLTNARNILPLPETQIVIHADGFGNAPQKIRTYKDFVAAEPVQFTGFKLFYKNDPNSPDGHLMTPSEVLKLSPQPVYIQYQ